MQVVILAGGFGTRISEESALRPKPMIELIDGRPILWHVMKYYSAFGFNDFIICAGYKASIIKEYFANYYLLNSDVTFDYRDSNAITYHHKCDERWKVSVFDTGLNTMTGGRIKRIGKYIERGSDGNGKFLMTYGDGVANVDLNKLIDMHNKSGKLATLTAVQPGGRFGKLDFDGDLITNFKEKAIDDGGWINGGFMVLDTRVLDYISGDSIMFENEPMQEIAVGGQLIAYKHTGFWQCMDTLRDKQKLDELIKNNSAPWMVW